MTLARPLFLAALLVLVALLVGTASSAFAADDAQSQTLSNSLPDATSAEIAKAVADPSGLIFSVAEPRTLNHPPVTAPPLAKLDDGVCYTIRMYKVKPTERLADGVSGKRGYSTCEMAENYQVRSAIAHTRIEDDAKQNGPK